MLRAYTALPAALGHLAVPMEHSIFDKKPTGHPVKQSADVEYCYIVEGHAHDDEEEEAPDEEERVCTMLPRDATVDAMGDLDATGHAMYRDTAVYGVLPPGDVDFLHASLSPQTQAEWANGCSLPYQGLVSVAPITYGCQELRSAYVHVAIYETTGLQPDWCSAYNPYCNPAQYDPAQIPAHVAAEVPADWVLWSATQDGPQWEESTADHPAGERPAYYERYTDTNMWMPNGLADCFRPDPIGAELNFRPPIVGGNLGQFTPTDQTRAYDFVFVVYHKDPTKGLDYVLSLGHAIEEVEGITCAPDFVSKPDPRLAVEQIGHYDDRGKKLETCTVEPHRCFDGEHYIPK